MSIKEDISDSCNDLDLEAVLEFAQHLVDEAALMCCDQTPFHQFLWNYVGLVAPDGTAAEPAPYLEGHRLIEGIDCEFSDVIYSGFNPERRELIHIRRFAGSSQDMLVARLDVHAGEVTFWDEVDIETEDGVTTLAQGLDQPVIVIKNLEGAAESRDFFILVGDREYKYIPLNILVEKVKTTTSNILEIAASTGSLAISGSTLTQEQY